MQSLKCHLNAVPLTCHFAPRLTRSSVLFHCRFVMQERADLWDSYYERHFLKQWDDVDTIRDSNEHSKQNEKDEENEESEQQEVEEEGDCDSDDGISSNHSSSLSSFATPTPVSPPPEREANVNSFANPSRFSLYLAHQINCNVKRTKVSETEPEATGSAGTLFLAPSLTPFARRRSCYMPRRSTKS